MARKICIDAEEVQKAKQLRDQAATVSEYRRALSVILVAEYGFDADRTADVLGTSRRTVFRDRSNIRNQDDTSKKTWGGRRNFSMTIEEEREFLSQWQEKAASGGVLTVPPMHAALVERLGHAIPCRQPIGCWHAMGGAKCNRIQNTQRAILQRRMSSKKTPGSSGCRLLEK